MRRVLVLALLLGSSACNCSEGVTGPGDGDDAGTNRDAGPGVCDVTCGTDALCCAAGESCFLDSECCAQDKQCDTVCCGADEICELGFCKLDCGGGVASCGPQRECCEAAEVCYLGACVVPGDPCEMAGCATRPDETACPPGQVCDPGLGRCIERQVDESCVYVPEVGVFEPRPLFTWGQRLPRNCMTEVDCQTGEACNGGMCEPTWPHVVPGVDDLPDHHQATSIPMVTDLDGDCIPEVVFNTYAQSQFTADGVLRAIRGNDGTKVWTVTDPAYRTDATANPAIGDVDGDGRPEIYVSSPGKEVLAFDADGSPRWTSDTYQGPEGSGAVTLANLDGQGHAEIVFGAVVLDSTGTIVFEGLEGRGHGGQGPISCVADLDGDDRPELVAGNTIYEFTGLVGNGSFAGTPRVSAMTADGYCGIADLDGDQAPEIVLVAGGTVYVLAGQTAAVRAQIAIPGGGHGGAPNIADFDGDGVPDIGTAGATNYIVLRYDGASTLTELWRAPTEDDSSSRTGSSVFDFDGDGRNEVVYNDEEFLRIYPGTEPDCAMSPPGPGCDGVMNDDEILFRDLNSSRTRTEYPVIADVDGDFKAEIVFATSNEAGFLDPMFVGDAGIEVWRDSLDNWVATRAVWNQHAYHITNVGLLGELPEDEPESWLTPAAAPYNSYRRNAQGDRETFCAPDLRLVDGRIDTSACPEILFTGFVVNEGCLGVGAGVEVALYDENGTFLGSGRTASAIAPGAAAPIEVRVAGQGMQFSIEVYAVVDDDGTGMGANNECKEDNNASDRLVATCRTDF